MILSKIKQFKTSTETNYQSIQVKCDICGKEWKSALCNQKAGFEKYKKDLCKGCKQHEQIVLGIRGKQYVNAGLGAIKSMRGKTVEEILGNEKGKEFRKKCSRNTSGKNNPNYGGIWYGINPAINQKGKTYKELYGEEKANKIVKKISAASSGENNPMYGKPSPQGSGNGWSGWYKGWYFRSLKELSYMINVIERFNLQWEVGEKKKFKINYNDFYGNKRTYYPDFLIEGKYLVEIKPKILWNSYNVKRKKEAAINFCKEHNFTYKLTECPKLISYNEIKQLIKEKKLIFIKRYQEKFNEWEN
jgi:NUMOD3 motif